MTINRKVMPYILVLAMALSFCCVDPAFSASKPAKVTITTGEASSTSQIELTWKSVNGAKGYQIYRNNKKIKTNSGNSNVKFIDTGLKENTTYTYKVRAYTTVKKKMWYNKKTKKWQTKKPKKKYRGKSKKRKVTVYGAFSANKSMTTKQAVAPVTQVTDSLEIVGSAPAKVYKTGKFYVEFKLPCEGTLKFESSDTYVIGVGAASTTKVQLYAKDDAGTATVTATFTPASGYICSGNTVVTFDVENVMYPYNEDGSYTVVCDRDLYGYAHEPTAVGGMFEEFTNILFRIPNNAVIETSYANMKDAPNPNTNTYGWGKAIISSSSNPSVVTVDNRGAHFVGTGTTVLTLTDGKKVTVISR